MSPFRAILFAADFSENSLGAFPLACSLAAENQTRLIVLHVVEPDEAAKEQDARGQPPVGLSSAGSAEARHE
jgi:nucleotide-binding universal stress UspA family protein